MDVLHVYGEGFRGAFSAIFDSVAFAGFWGFGSALRPGYFALLHGYVGLSFTGDFDLLWRLAFCLRRFLLYGLFES